MICRTNQLVGFNAMAALAFNELRLPFVSGEIIGINHTELVGWWNFAFRGNCKNESGNSGLLIVF